MFTAPLDERRAVGEEERDVGAERYGEIVQVGRRKRGLERRVGELSHAFNERPVMLITAIYHIAERASPLNCPPLR